MKHRKYLIGRAMEKTDITLNDGTISRIHAEIEIKNKKLYIKDLGSSNGTIVNGVQMQPQISSEISFKKNIYFGKSKYFITVDNDARSNRSSSSSSTDKKYPRRERERSRRKTMLLSKVEIPKKKREESSEEKNERQVKLYNEYLRTKELDIKSDIKSRLPKLLPIEYDSHKHTHSHSNKHRKYKKNY